jgi:tRNA 2-(methylsulfanyl)-N6-isopentenyladenosine37 hydroxylase
MSAAPEAGAPAQPPDDILQAPTPPEWVAAAVADWPRLLIDHANCEKKAASTALALMFAYPEDRELGMQLARLAREELRHFEQVSELMRSLGVVFVRQHPGRYAAELRAALRTTEPGRKLDQLLMGALIEARSAERFRVLLPHLPQPLVALYRRLAHSEARHFAQYLALAQRCAPTEWRSRLAHLAALEGQLVVRADTVLRFHSGPPQPRTGAPRA